MKITREAPCRDRGDTVDQTNIRSDGPMSGQGWRQDTGQSGKRPDPKQGDGWDVRLKRIATARNGLEESIDLTP